MIHEKYQRCQDNHPHSKKSKFKRPHVHNTSDTIELGNIVYLRSEGDKTNQRPRYLVTDVTQTHCLLRRLTDTQLRQQQCKVLIKDVYKVSHHTKQRHVPRPTLPSTNSDNSSVYTPAPRNPQAQIPASPQTPDMDQDSLESIHTSHNTGTSQSTHTPSHEQTYSASFLSERSSLYWQNQEVDEYQQKDERQWEEQGFPLAIFNLSHNTIDNDSQLKFYFLVLQYKFHINSLSKNCQNTCGTPGKYGPALLTRGNARYHQ